MKSLKLTALSYYVDRHGDVTDRVFSTKGGGSIASGRLQFHPALVAARQLDFDIKSYSLHSDRPSDVLKAEIGDLCLVGKMSANTKEHVKSMIIANMEYLTRAKNKGSKIIIQYSDNLLARKDMIGDFHRDLISFADHIVYPSRKLHELTSKHLPPSSDFSIIRDPWQVPELVEPRELNTDEPLRLIWFGSNANIHYLVNSIPDITRIKSKRTNIILTILGGDFSHQKFTNYYNSLSEKITGWTFELVRWDIHNQPNQLISELSKAHIAFIPSDPNDPMKAGVSHNRLVDALRAGCVPIASPMDSYLELQDMSLLGTSMADLLKKALTNYDALRLKIKNNACHKLSVYDPKNNLKSWKKLLSSFVQEDN